MSHSVGVIPCEHRMVHELSDFDFMRFFNFFFLKSVQTFAPLMQNTILKDQSFMNVYSLLQFV